MTTLSKKQKLLLKEILTTDDHSRRDKIALELSDQGVVELISFIITLLFRPETKMHRSTLIYCLQRYNVDDFGPDDFFFLSEYAESEDNYGCKFELQRLFRKLNMGL